MDITLNSTLITLISIITTGLVSILSIFVPIYIEARKAQQAGTSSERERIESATLGLLGEISHFRRPIQGDIERASGRPIQQAISDLRIKHYAWEQTIWHKVGEDHQERIKVLRRKFEILSSDHSLVELAKEISDVTDEILAITRIGSGQS